LCDEIAILTPGLVAATTLAPLVVLPMIGSGTNLSRQGATPAAAGALVGVVLLNLCLLLPALIIACYAGQRGLGEEHQIRGLGFPMAVWRVDTVLLVVLCLFLVPVSMNRWKLGQAEGLLLVAGYAAYLAAAMALGLRW
jgi:Ca2+/Na+ antiporter